MFTDVKTAGDARGPRSREFPNTIEKNEPDKSWKISRLISEN
jgi:hypothetical protein